MWELVASTITITFSNVNGDLKPKGMLKNRWCWFNLNLDPTKGMSYEVVVKHGGRETSEGSLVSCRSKDGMACDGPLPSLSVNHYFVLLLQNNKIKGKVLVSCGRQVTT